MEMIIEHKDTFILLAFAISEVLSLIPSVKANGLFQLVYFQLKKLKK
jgi:hypothetical protein